jgi:hypothetical protein
MERPMRLKCTVMKSDSAGMYLVRSELYDGTVCEFKTESHNVELNEALTEERTVVEGWVNVHQIAKQSDIVKINLPSPSLVFGKLVNVKEWALMPLGMSINSFNSYKR